MQICTPFLLKKNSKLLRMLALILPMVCLLGLLAQTAFAENTYVITDGDQVTVYISRETDPEEVLNEAGFQLDEDDSYTTQESDGVSEIVVRRSQVIQVWIGDEQMQVNSYGESVESVLNRLGIAAHTGYQVSQPLSAMTYDGMQIRVDRVIEDTQTYTKEIAYETILCYDPSLPDGEQRVITTGVPGVMRCQDTVIYVNNQEQIRIPVSHTVLQQPLNAMVAVGIGEGVQEQTEAPVIGDGFIVLPTGEMLTYYKSEKFSATAYTKTDAGCDDYTATGTQVHEGVVAVDPKVIPYGTRMFIVTNDGAYIYGLATAEDCGGGIKGNHLDLYFDTEAECWQFGVRNCTVYFLSGV